ncbi:MAG: biopolymer transporter ExbD, partial [Planctomycetales bacterium]|nr:biopolymer transporter ExbD [Planctomycetales bacterium]
MKVRARGNFADEKIELQMTPMIDIVFQLLVFFIMTFKIAAMEGDFNIKMPLSAPSEGSPEEREMPPFQLRMAANPDGSLRSMRLDQQTLGANIGSPEHAAQAFVGLRQEIVTRVGDASGPGSVRETASVKL